MISNLTRKFKRYFLIFFFCLYFLFTSEAALSIESSNWIKVAANDDEVQFIDINSLKYKKGIMSVLTKNIQINPETNESLSSKFSEIQVKCSNRLIKSDNGKWKEPQGVLMKNTIINSCTY